MGEFSGSVDYFVDESRVFTGQNNPKLLSVMGQGAQHTKQLSN